MLARANLRPRHQNRVNALGLANQFWAAWPARFAWERKLEDQA
jgi:hypothetical protein